MSNDRLNGSLEALFREIKRVQAAKRAAPPSRKPLWWRLKEWLEALFREIKRVLEALFDDIKRVQAAKRTAPPKQPPRSQAPPSTKTSVDQIAELMMAAERRRRGRIQARACVAGVIALIWLIGALAPKHEDETPAQPPKPKLSYMEEMRQIAGDRAVPTTSSAYDAARGVIRAAGYDCPEVNLLIRWVFSEGLDAYCRDGRYKFELANHGGIWTVTPP